MKAFPSFVVTNAKGETIRGWIGFDSTESFLEQLEAAISDPVSMQTRLERFETDPTEKDAAAVGAYYLQQMNSEKAVAAFLQARALSDSSDRTYASDLFMARLIGSYSGQVDLEGLITAAGEIFAAENLRAPEAIQVANAVAAAASREGKASLAAPFVDQAVSLAGSAVPDPSQERAYENLLIEHALIVDQDAGRALELERASMGENWEESSEKLNGFAWWCFEHGINLEQAERLAQHGIELADDGSDKAMILDTLAEIRFARGDHKGAVEAAEAAADEEPGNEYYQKQLVRFRSETAVSR